VDDLHARTARLVLLSCQSLLTDLTDGLPRRLATQCQSKTTPSPRLSRPRHPASPPQRPSTSTSSWRGSQARRWRVSAVLSAKEPADPRSHLQPQEPVGRLVHSQRQGHPWQAIAGRDVDTLEVLGGLCEAHRAVAHLGDPSSDAVPGELFTARSQDPPLTEQNIILVTRPTLLHLAKIKLAAESEAASQIDTSLFANLSDACTEAASRSLDLLLAMIKQRIIGMERRPFLLRTS
jgi:hypothetical protein